MLKVGSLLNIKNRKDAARELARGEIIGIFNRGVCALWFDGGNVKAVEKVSKIKGEKRHSRPVALTLSLDEFVPLIDVDKLPKKTREFLLLPDLKSRIGSLCFIRAPLKSEYLKIVPKNAQNFDDGICMVQNWDSFGHTPTEKFLTEVKKLGITHPAVTSMNISGEPEIVDQKEGIVFCQRFNIPIFLRDPKAHPTHFGSYTIFTFDKNGIRLERDGNIPAKLFKFIFGFAVNTKSAKPAKHQQLNFPVGRLKKLSPPEIRTAILNFLVQ